MIEWFRWWHANSRNGSPGNISVNAILVADIAHSCAIEKKCCYPNWREVQKTSSLGNDEFMEAFTELERLRIVFSGFPSLLLSLVDKWPIPPMFGRMPILRPSAEVWNKIRANIFKRDNYTCQYCGEYGKKLECDHVIPVSRGGSHQDDNLVAACFKCNRSKRDKLIEEWLQ
jgi:hypothetical protein